MTTTFVQNTKSGKWEIDKDPQAVLDYVEDWTAWLDAIGDTLQSHTVTVTGSDVASTAARQSSVIVGKMVHVWISGGVPGETVTVDFSVTTVGGRTDNRRCYLKIKER